MKKSTQDFVWLLLTPILLFCIVAPESTIANIKISSTKLAMNLNIENTKARPNDTAFNIQHDCLLSRMSTKSSHSSFSSLMNNLPLLECNYAKWVVAQNNMNIEVTNTSSIFGLLLYDFTIPPLQTPYVFYKKMPNSISTSNINMLSEPFLPMVISYSSNILANPNLWDSNFIATFLFSTNEFLQSNIHNMACLL